MYSEKKLLHLRQKEYQTGNLRTLSLDSTSKCNMNCPHCYAQTFMNVEAVDLDSLKRTFDEAYDLGVFHYVIQGGEPIVDKDRLEKIIARLYPDESYLNVVSNGWEMTRENIRWLKNLKVDKIAFSLDSGLEKEHDAGRGIGSYNRVMKAIDDTISENLLVSISTVVTHDSLYSEGFNRALEYVRSKGIRIDAQIAMPVGRWDGKKDLLIDPRDAAYIKDLQKKYGVLPNGQRMINRDIYNFGGADHCPAGLEFMAITADGNFLPCNFCQFSLGNIRERSISEMRSALLKSRWFNGKNPCCLLGEDGEFIDKYVVPYVDSPKPLDAYRLFDLQEGLK